MYHYVYRITSIREQKHYYGSRSSRQHPRDDLGVSYFSSSSDQSFLLDQKENPQSYRYKIIVVTKCRERATMIEQRLHNIFSVDTNKNFFNRAKQTSEKFYHDVAHNRDNRIFTFTHKDGRQQTCSVYEMGVLYSSKHFGGLVRGIHRSVKGWSVSNHSRTKPLDFVCIQDVMCHFVNKMSGEEFVGTYGEFVLKTGIDFSRNRPFFDGRKVSKNDWMYKDAYDKHIELIERKRPCPAIIDTKFLFVVNNIETETTPRILSEESGVALSELLTLIRGDIKTCRGIHMAWNRENFAPIGRTDQKTYHLCSPSGDTVSLTRADMKEVFGVSEGAISMFLSGKTKTCRGYRKLD